MDEINKALQRLDTTLRESSLKLKHKYSDAIHATSNHFHTVYKDFDSLASKYIEPASNASADSQLFNPRIVVEFQDGKANKIVRFEDNDWKHDMGYLPNRKEMYSIALHQFPDKELAKNIAKINVSNFGSIVTDYNTIAHYNFNTENDAHLPWIQFKDKIASKIYAEQILIIDNYLNIHLPSYFNEKKEYLGGIYLCLNKVAFPQFAFSTGIKYETMYVYHGDLFNPGHDATVFSKDKEKDVFWMANKCIPDNHKEVYKYFDGIRAMIHSKVFNSDMERTKELEEENVKLKAELENQKELIEKYKASM